MIKAIFYDLDGVLVDACDWHYHALNDALEEHCGFTISYEEHLEKYNGLSTKMKLKMMGLDEPTAIKVWEVKQARTLKNIRRFGFRDQYKENLHRWTAAQGIRIACVTNSIRESAREMLKVTGQLDYLDFIITNEDVTKNKPHPDCYLLALEKIGLQKDEVLIVEDSPKGRAAAHASGIPVIEVENAFDVTLDFIKGRLS